MTRPARFVVVCLTSSMLIPTLSCTEEKAELGESCGGHAKDPIGCVSGLLCCQPDPRIFDIPGTCVAPAEQSGVGEACGASTGSCCGSGSWCSIWNQESGDGTCVANVG